MPKNRYKHGQAIHSISGRKLWSPEYSAWVGMKHRCNCTTGSRFASYGGRGILVCSRWQGCDGFKNFLADMGKRPSSSYSLDRIDNDGNYEPSNCRWATAGEQSRNRRKVNLFYSPFVMWAWEIHEEAVGA